MTIKEKRFEHVKEMRHISFCFVGQIVRSLHDGKYGTVTGSNSSYNLDVLWAGFEYTDNVHPHWMIEYFEEDIAMLKEVAIGETVKLSCSVIVCAQDTSEWSCIKNKHVCVFWQDDTCSLIDHHICNRDTARIVFIREEGTIAEIIVRLMFIHDEVTVHDVPLLYRSGYDVIDAALKKRAVKVDKDKGISVCEKQIIDNPIVIEANYIWLKEILATAEIMWIRENKFNE